MIRRILNNGAVAPIEVQVSGRDHDAAPARSPRCCTSRSRSWPASTTPTRRRASTCPSCSIVVDRNRAAAPGLTESDVIRNVITAPDVQRPDRPNFWIDPQTGNPYVIGVQYPEYAVERHPHAGGDPRHRRARRPRRLRPRRHAGRRAGPRGRRRCAWKTWRRSSAAWGRSRSTTTRPAASASCSSTSPATTWPASPPTSRRSSAASRSSTPWTACPPDKAGLDDDQQFTQPPGALSAEADRSDARPTC